MNRVRRLVVLWDNADVLTTILSLRTDAVAMFAATKHADGNLTTKFPEKEIEDDIRTVQDIGSVVPPAAHWEPQSRAHGGTLTVTFTAEETCFTLKFPA
jgi:hypothetical protein